MIVHACQIKPAFIATQFYKSGTKHNAYDKPSIEQYANEWWWWTRIEFFQRKQWHQKYCQKSAFKQLAFPAKRIPNLANVHYRMVHNPQGEHDNAIRTSSQHHQAGKSETFERQKERWNFISLSEILFLPVLELYQWMKSDRATCSNYFASRQTKVLWDTLQTSWIFARISSSHSNCLEMPVGLFASCIYWPVWVHWCPIIVDFDWMQSKMQQLVLLSVFFCWLKKLGIQWRLKSKSHTINKSKKSDKHDTREMIGRRVSTDCLI